MDKQFWAALAANDYSIPPGHTLPELTRAILDYLGSTDPELRDEIAYSVYAHWLKQERYTKEEIDAHIQELLNNLQNGIGETESDSVFLRAFSVLIMAEIVHNDNKKPLLEKEQIRAILAKGLWYLPAEKDLRGYIRVKGWAHALAHTADLMLVLGRNRNLNKQDLLDILDALAARMIHATRTLYIHGEEGRMARAVIEILRRDLLSLEEIQAWARSFTAPDGKDWEGAYLEEGRNRAFQNTRNLLRSIYFMVLDDNRMPNREELTQTFLRALQDLRP